VPNLRHNLPIDQLPKPVVERLNSIFNGREKAIKRNSGGLVLAKPTEIVTPQGSTDSLSEIRIRMVFFELERNQQHQIISKKIITASKLVSVSEVEEGFEPYPGIGGFVVDLGLGIIPVHFISSHFDHFGFEWALVARQDEYEKAKMSDKPEKITLFEVPRALLRWIEPISLNEQKDFQWAKRHLKNLVNRGEIIVPELLVVAPSCPVDPSLSVQEMDEKLKIIPRPLSPTWELSLSPLNENSDG